MVQAWLQASGSPAARVRVVEADEEHVTYDVGGARVVVRPPGGSEAGWATPLGVLSAA